jgi:predicted choloylglycine hydrolase
MKRRIIITLLAVVMLVASLVSPACSPHQPQSTFDKVDDYPLYTANLYEDYHFDDYLKTGILPFSPIIPPNPMINGQPTVDDFSCTCFSAYNLPGQAIFGRNADWDSDFPVLMLFTHPAGGYASVSMVDMSVLGSATDQQKLLYAPYAPLDGMNERGLAIGVMAVPRTQAPIDANKVTINFASAIRLMLDNAQSVDEAITLLGEYNIDFLGYPLHYLIADAHGNSAVVEFVAGEMKVIRSEQPWQVSTNFVLSLIPESVRSWFCWRYATANETLQQSQGKMSHENAMALLKNVAQPLQNYLGPVKTIWSAVYDMGNGEIEIAMDRHYDQVYHFKLEMKK